MEALSDITGRITGQQQPRRTHQPVRRHSHTKGREGTFWRPTTRREVRQIVLAAEKFDRAGRMFGQRNGPLGHVALEVLEYFANLVSYRTGQLDPALDTIAAKLKRSKAAIVDALKALRAYGFLDWLRRYVPTENEGRGPQVRQTSNAYRLSLPAAARRLLGRYGQPAPAPDDFTHAKAQRTAEIEAYRAQLPAIDAALFEVTDEGLESSLRRLMEAMDRRQERESAKRSESMAQ